MSIHPISKSNYSKGKLFLFGDIDEKSACNIIQKMRYIFFDFEKEDIYLYIHSDGGEYEAMFAIIDEMIGLESLGAKIHTIALGKAFSVAAFILAMGTERYATANSTIMLHEMQMDAEWVGEPLKNIKVDADFGHKIYKHTINMIAERCGHTTKTKKENFIEKVGKVMWLMPKEAQKEGIIDGIWKYEWELPTEDNEE